MARVIRVPRGTTHASRDVRRTDAFPGPTIAEAMTRAARMGDTNKVFQLSNTAKAGREPLRGFHRDANAVRLPCVHMR